MTLTDKPTVPGWYWVKNLEDSSWLKIMYFCADEIEDMLDDWQSWSMSWNEGMMIHMGAQFFGPLPTPDKMVELLRLVDEVASWDDSLIDKRDFPEDAEDMASDIRGLKAYADKLRKEAAGYTCRRVLVVDTEGGGE